MENAPSRPPTVEPDPARYRRASADRRNDRRSSSWCNFRYNLICNAAQISVWMSARLGQERTLAAATDVSCVWIDDLPA